jgi:hypothetical protein
VLRKIVLRKIVLWEIVLWEIVLGQVRRPEEGQDGLSVGRAIALGYHLCAYLPTGSGPARRRGVRTCRRSKATWPLTAAVTHARCCQMHTLPDVQPPCGRKLALQGYEVNHIYQIVICGIDRMAVHLAMSIAAGIATEASETASSPSVPPAPLRPH